MGHDEVTGYHSVYGACTVNLLQEEARGKHRADWTLDRWEAHVPPLVPPPPPEWKKDQNLLLYIRTDEEDSKTRASMEDVHI